MDEINPSKNDPTKHFVKISHVLENLTFNQIKIFTIVCGWPFEKTPNVPICGLTSSKMMMKGPFYWPSLLFLSPNESEYI